MADNRLKYDALRRRYPEFVYEAYHCEEVAEGLRVWFDFRMGDVVFHPEAVVTPRALFSAPDAPLSTPQLEWTVFNIGMVELVSYWKCACPPVVRVLCGSLDEEQVAFWKKLYWNGLGEFFYTNGIAETPEAFMSIDNPKLRVDNTLPHPDNLLSLHNSQSYLVPVGGGKDSVVTLELLRRAGHRVRPLIMNPRGATVSCAEVAGFPMEEVLVIRRTIDPTLLELNRQGYLNGHTPFSAMLAFYTLLAAQLTGIPNVALSNESSANESTVIGSTVNHQYSKSLEFEDDFRRYVASARVGAAGGTGDAGGRRGTLPATPHSPLPTFNYFSFLRPLSELQIAMLFSRMTQYHDVFRSCNVGSKQDVWCGHCAKCLFAYIILSPFIEPSRLEAIFGKSMLDDLSLLPELRQLLGLEATKPFECVGTVGEVRQALTMALRRWYPDRRPALLQYVDGSLAPDEWIDLEVLSPTGNLSADERAILQKACTGKNN